LTYAKIPGDGDVRVACLQALFIALTNNPRVDLRNPRDLAQIAETKLGVDALLTYAKIPGNPEEQLVRVNALFTALTDNPRVDLHNPRDLAQIAETKWGVDALLTYAKIPGNPEEQLVRVNALFIALTNNPGVDLHNPGDLAQIAETKWGQDALLTYARIPGNPEEQLACLRALIDKSYYLDEVERILRCIGDDEAYADRVGEMLRLLPQQ